VNIIDLKEKIILTIFFQFVENVFSICSKNFFSTKSRRCPNMFVHQSNVLFFKKFNKIVLIKIVWLKNMFLINKISENYCFDRNFLQQ
jgi:hypothetical protein